MQQSSNGLTFSNALASAIGAYASIERIKRESDLVDLQIERDRLNLSALSQNQQAANQTPVYTTQITPVEPSQNIAVAGLKVNKYVLGGTAIMLTIGAIALIKG